MYIYFLSFFVVFTAEICGTLRDLFLQQKKKYASAVALPLDCGV